MQETVELGLGVCNICNPSFDYTTKLSSTKIPMAKTLLRSVKVSSIHDSWN
ncbi:MAG: hypothetical protein LH615_05035 [Ferruginibacter sp.]|nr:hypothetical protein [Ferruginibacter sp.]